MFLLNDENKKTVDDSSVEEKLDFHLEDNDSSFIFTGGKIVSMIDNLALKAAEKHAGTVCETKSIDSIKFLRPVKNGDILYCYVSVNHVWRSEMEVGVKILAEDLRLLEKKHILSAYFTFKPKEEISLSEIKPVSKIQIKRYLAAEKRRFFRKKKNRLFSKIV